MTIKIFVQGSAPKPYTIEVFEDESVLKMFCSCPAGWKGWMCKHKESVIKNNLPDNDKNTQDTLNRIHHLIEKHNILAKFKYFEGLLKHTKNKDAIVDIRSEMGYLVNPPNVINVTFKTNDI